MNHPTHLCEDHDVCTARSLAAAGMVQTIPAFDVAVTLRHKLENLRSSDHVVTFNGDRFLQIRALNPYVVSGREGFRSAYFKEHPEFVGQGWWRGPYPQS